MTTASARPRGLLANLCDGVRRLDEEDRRRHPYAFVAPDGDVLFVENVARLLGASLDTVRRIPRDQLPATRVGNRVIYLREDVVRYVRNRRDDGASVQPVAPLPRTGAATSTYDPVAHARGVNTQRRKVTR